MMRRLIRVIECRGVPVYAHWSIPVLCGAFFLASLDRLEIALTAIPAYIGVLLLHEGGHQILAVRRGCHVWSIEIYPIHGLCRFEDTGNAFDLSVIAWGGVLAQLAVALPLILWVSLFGYTRFEAVNAPLAILGYFSAAIAVFNLMPLGRLDGRLAWRLVPLLLRRRIKSVDWPQRKKRRALKAIK